ncbi:MAG: hypothetical protein H8Z69_00965 [Nanohaloarchaea archaeon]|nr:hypothetical protein [Candidatus Nanohaloarchaea archaeon]
MASTQPKNGEDLEKVAERLNPVKGKTTSADRMGRHRLMTDGSGDREGRPDLEGAENIDQEAQGDGGAYGKFGQTEPVNEDSGFNIDITRRQAVAGGGSILAALGLGFGATQLDQENNQRETGVANPSDKSAPTGNETRNKEDPTESDVDDQTSEEPINDGIKFAEIYNDTIPGAGFDSFSQGEVRTVKRVEQREDTSAALERTVELLENRNDPAAERGFKEVVHNDLGYTEDQVRVLDRNHSDGTPFAAVMVKNEEGDWVKDLMSFTGTETGYLRHDEDSLDSSGERGLNDIVREGGNVASATIFSRIREYIQSFGARDSFSDSEWKEIAESYNVRNDHIVVGDVEDRGEITYTPDAASAVEDIMKPDGTQVFNQEMEMVEAATEFYHNQMGEYGKVDVKTGELEEGEVELTQLESGETLYMEEVDAEIYNELALTLYEAE